MHGERTLKKISLEKLGVPAENLRRHNVDLEMDDLETNIHALGQSQAVLVYESSDSEGMYEVIDGQRRLNAFVNLNKKFCISFNIILVCCFLVSKENISKLINIVCITI